MGAFIWFAFALFCSVKCYEIAKKNNWNTWVAAMIGFLAPIISIIGYSYFSKENQAEVRMRERKRFYGKYTIWFRDFLSWINNFGRSGKVLAEGDLDILSYKSVGEFYEDATAKGYKIPSPMCHALTEAMQKSSLTFADAYLQMLHKGKITVEGKTYIYDLSTK